jgi:SAM-dependent methyltransferase
MPVPRALLPRPQLFARNPLRLAIRSRLRGRSFADSPTGNSNSARYCYAVWMRHLVLACRAAGAPVPIRVAELGPGDSVGVGLAALLSGAEHYLAFDAVAHALPENNQRIFEDLVQMFRARVAIPTTEEIPNLRPVLSDYRFPSDLLPDERLQRTLAPERLDLIRACLRGRSTEVEPLIRYVAPWIEAAPVVAASVDMAFSQAVMEHVDNLPQAYATLFRWLRPGGIMSHQIDFKCHGTARDWNGHWTYSDLVWGLIRADQAYLINRQPHSRHVALLTRLGFKVVLDLDVRSPTCVQRRQLARRFCHLTDADLQTSGAFILAIRPLDAKLPHG